MSNATSNAAINNYNNQKFDFSNIADLGTFWDGGSNASNWGGGQFDLASMSGNAKTSHNVDLLYQNLIGRNADPSGRQYWIDQISSGANTYQTLADTLKGSNEYTDQQSYLADNPNATADDLKGLSSAWVSPFHANSGSVMAGWQPGDPITAAHANSISSGYSDQTNMNVGDIQAGITGGVGNGSTQTGINNDQWSTFMDSFNTLSNKFNSLQDAFSNYKTQSASDMQNMWNNANWGWGQTVGGVRTQNELPGWAPKKGGTSGFFGRGGRSGKGLTTSSLNI